VSLKNWNVYLKNREASPPNLRGLKFTNEGSQRVADAQPQPSYQFEEHRISSVGSYSPPRIGTRYMAGAQAADSRRSQDDQSL